jgi:outer membrane immunogenic protein
MSLSVR